MARSVSPQLASNSSVVQTGTAQIRLFRLRAKDRERVINKLRGQGRDVVYRDGAVFENVSFNKVVESKDAQGRVTQRQTFAKQGEKIRLVKVESFDGNQTETINKSFKGERFSGETVQRNGRTVRDTRGQTPRVAIYTRREALQMQKDAARQTRLEKEQAKRDLLVEQNPLFAQTAQNRDLRKLRDERQAQVDVISSKGRQRFSKAAEPPTPFLDAMGERVGIENIPFRDVRERNLQRGIAAAKGDTDTQGKIVLDAGVAVGGFAFGAGVLQSSIGLGLSPVKTALTAGATFTASAFAGSVAIDTVQNVRTSPDILPDVKAARRIQRDAEDQFAADQGLISRENVRLSLNPGLKTEETKQAGSRAVQAYFDEQGISEANQGRILKELESRDYVEARQRGFFDIASAEVSGEIFGRAFSAVSLGGKAGSTTAKTAVKTTLTKVLPGISMAGAIEGTQSAIIEPLASSRPVDLKQIGTSAGIGAISAPLAATPIIGFDILSKTGKTATTRTISKGASGFFKGIVEIAEGGKEFLGDVITDVGVKGSSRIPVFTPTINVVPSTTTSTTKTSKSRTPNVVKPSNVVRTQASFTSTQARTRPKVLTFNPSSFAVSSVSPTGTPSQTPTDPFTTTPTKTEPFTTTPIKTETPIKPTTRTTTTTSSSTSTSVDVFIPTPVSDRFGFPTVQPGAPGGGGRKIKFPKFTRQKGGFAPSLAGLESGLTQSKAPKFTPGIGIRLPVLNTAKINKRSRGIFNIVGDTDFRFEVKPSKKKKTKKKRKKKK